MIATSSPFCASCHHKDSRTDAKVLLACAEITRIISSCTTQRSATSALYAHGGLQNLTFAIHLRLLALNKKYFMYDWNKSTLCRPCVESHSPVPSVSKTFSSSQLHARYVLTAYRIDQLDWYNWGSKILMKSTSHLCAGTLVAFSTSTSEHY